MPMLPLTDSLAIDRTTLANERTLLAYTRTALGMIVLAISFVEFLDRGLFVPAAYLLFALGGMVQAVGLIRFIQVRNHLKRLRLESSPTH